MENEIKSETKVKKAVKKNKGALNKETSKVLGCIVKNAGLTATKIGKKLRWAFTPTRALGFLRSNKYVTVSKADGTYSVSANGTAALTAAPKPMRKKAVKKSAPPVVAAEAGPIVDENTVMPEAPVLEEAAV